MYEIVNAVIYTFINNCYSGGLSNYLYYVSLPRNDELENTVVTTTSENTARNQRDQIEFTSESRLNNTELSKQTFLNNDYKRKRNDSGSYFLATNHKLDEPREVCFFEEDLNLKNN